ncbi:uncharacterized protein LOC117117559 isoform X2 [Anneissia japonica]|uniref:uncharacterized protein LOC117117559 isoform X2 n=1 Tax=Anneissia japonica TaxID=1529436 RepID=UPI0014254C63|nr:uncharacterized protein LOC117117559 isoform X2 [Anneissia japonica]
MQNMELGELGPPEKDVQIIKETENAVTELNRNQDNLPTSNNTAENGTDIVYTVANNGTQRGRRLLLDSRGYSYTVKLDGKKYTYWWCSMRNRSRRCCATVRQTADGFRAGKRDHSHAPKPKCVTKVNIVTEIKERSKLMIHDSARSVVQDVITKYLNAEVMAGSLPCTDTLIRLANRAREPLRPNNPKHLKFKINYKYMPEDYIKADIEIECERHILLATTDQLSILADTRIWFVDCTNKFIQQPFTKLLSIHTFVRTEHQLKTVPLAFVLMSKHRQRDYKAVLEHIIKILPHRQSVRKCVLDFEIPMWKAFHSVLPNVSLQGCSFHWVKCVLKKVQKITTVVEAEIRLARKVMALVYIPPEEIEDALSRLEKQAKKSRILSDIIKHIDKQWVQSSFWSPQHWSVFERIVRTTEDVEGWHKTMVEKDKGEGIGMYKLVEQLHTVSLDLPFKWRLVSNEKLYTLQREKKHCQQAKLFKFWRRYLKQKISIDELIDCCTLLDYPLI